ncbi:hypothetical protein GKG47_11305 [Lactonifactor sp. BIOML-A3]|uniref:SipW-dependent-type signal peptide-containing protein n=1 Tax=unclassified Lactonifactor TaxID=2636670 RepID=UPI0012AF91C2|nr:MULTISPECIES: SipW-dependent-type signal peptide-containing protein [unclassified Lactonifactor]MSA00386.1 hypothetical protein [Lactonifactor sp. BIOML-A5]MSA07555.1 hypothetical protein [Lactonifactor sp. BIOML-A4]MSA13014.1 hypothetical protein [Lactonifactor sp. BIOML-A3]MSA16799.1 hypothetical protein [Lactonifactor sp. BIOML-A2]MSA37459.1 hypothetical protein [Lactonifactor sp. BIOML-A1]
MMNRKKLTAVVASVALVAVLGIGGTLMYFTDRDTKSNVITMGNVNGSLIETTDTENAVNTEDGITYNDRVTPGDTLSKVPTVKLGDDSEDAYIRVKMTITGLDMVDAQGNKYADILENQLDIGNKWTKNVDGYYYYADKMSKKGETQALFTEVKVPEGWGNEVANAEVTIDLIAELIQADNFDSHLQKNGNNVIGWTGITEDDIEDYTVPQP